MTIKQTLSKHAYPIALLLLVLFLFVTNYEPGTFLMGWDSLQTGLNPLLGLKRAFHAVWQEYQSFGLTSGMAHAADLVRSIYVLFLSVILPASVVRYFFHFSMVFVGGLGVYYLFHYLGFRGKRSALAFIGAVFYILNLGSVQLLSLPFEPFTIFFAMLPWELLVFLRFCYSNRVTPKLLFWLVLINVLATSQAYLQTLFVVYFLVLGFFSIGIFVEKRSLHLLKRIVVAFAFIILVNLFWILPQIYFLMTSLDVVTSAKINQLATDIVTNQNIEKGTLLHFARMEGFYFDLVGQDKQLLFAPWVNHFNNLVIGVLSFVPFLFVLGGLTKKRRSHAGFVGIFVLTTLILLTRTPPFAQLNSLIFGHPFLVQIFRSPFTKFVVPFSLVFSYLFISGMDYIYSWFINKVGLASKKYLLAVSTGALFFIAVVFYPGIAGHYLSDSMRAEMPASYTGLIRYFDSQDKNARVALLPDYTFWGWFRTSWGYDGSGFLWYGIEQPIVSRTFDVWSLTSESYFWEIKDAIESKNAAKFEQVLAKYNIDYLILDNSLKPISSIEASMQYDQIASILDKTSKVNLVEEFGGLRVLKVDHNKNTQDFISYSKGVSSAGPDITLTNHDQAYADLGDYVSAKNPDYIYPFLDLTTQTKLRDPAWSISEDEAGNVILERDLVGYDLSNYVLERPEDVSLEAEVFLGTEVQKYEYSISEEIVDGKLRVKIAKHLIQAFEPSAAFVGNCADDLGNFGVIEHESSLSVVSGEGGKACFGYGSDLMAHWNSYLVKVDSDNTQGKGFLFYVFGNKTRKQSKVEVTLDGGSEYFILNPGFLLDDGYFFSFQNSSYEHLEAKNSLNALEVYLFPHEYVTKLRFVKRDLSGAEHTRPSSATFFDSEKLNYYSYKVDNPDQSGSTLILNQAYDDGWRAYKMSRTNKFAQHLPALFGEELKDHFMVNNWANGWEVPALQEGEYLLVTFTPQLLQYAGFVLLIGIWGIATLGVFIRVKFLEDIEKNI